MMAGGEGGRSEKPKLEATRPLRAWPRKPQGILLLPSDGQSSSQAAQTQGRGKRFCFLLRGTAQGHTGWEVMLRAIFRDSLPHFPIIWVRAKNIHRSREDGMGLRTIQAQSV